MSVFEQAIGVIAPPNCVSCGREGRSFCDACRYSLIISYGERCFGCGKSSAGGRVCEVCRGGTPRHVWVSTVYEDTAADLVKLYKFGHQRAAVNSLAEMMAETLSDFSSEDSIQKLNYLVVPLPTATKRVRQRSFDHSDLLARKIADQIGADYLPALGRMGQSRQLGSRRPDRLKQPFGMYRVKLPELITRRNILLIDDVTTTGATLKAATKELRAANAARIDALVFAKRL